MSDRDLELTEHAFRMCQQLLRIDTTNPPGNELPAAELLAEELSAAGLEPQVLESAPGRGNVVDKGVEIAVRAKHDLFSALDQRPKVLFIVWKYVCTIPGRA